jgi:hypothetical protein
VTELLGGSIDRAKYYNTRGISRFIDKKVQMPEGFRMDATTSHPAARRLSWTIFVSVALGMVALYAAFTAAPLVAEDPFGTFPSPKHSLYQMPPAPRTTSLLTPHEQLSPYTKSMTLDDNCFR